MDIKSLGFKTEMIFHRFDGIILDRGNYIVVKTPSMPGFFCGWEIRAIAATIPI